MKTYTTHELTPAMLRMLSEVCNERQRHANAGTAGALIRRGLIVERPEPRSWPRLHVATADGLAALRAARREGW